MKQLNLEPIRVELYGDKFRVNVFAKVADGRLEVVCHEHVTKKSSDDDKLPYELSMDIAKVPLAHNEFILHEDMLSEFSYPVIQVITAKQTRQVKVDGRMFSIVAIDPTLLVEVK